MNKIITFCQKNKEIINYLIVGILTTLISITSYAILTITVLNPNNEIQLQIANIISWIIAVIFAYITNKKYVFESKEKNIKKEFTKFTTSRITTLLIEMLFMYIFVSILKYNDKIMKVIAQLVVIILNYVFSKIFVFKEIKK